MYHRTTSWILLAIAILAGSASAPAADVWDLLEMVRPYGIAHRTPFTNSKVIGSPEPPLPFRIRQVYAGLELNHPLATDREPGTGDLLLIEQGKSSGPARLRRFQDRPDVTEAETLLEFEGILYGIAFHPNFDKNGYVYLGANTPASGNPRFNQVLRYTLERTGARKLLPDSKLLLLEWESNGHNGADLDFGPDGKLYISTGDGTSDSDTNLTGQDTTNLLACMLRIDVDHPAGDKPYSVPKDNPFLHLPEARPEIWAYGFRNPWKVFFDRGRNQLWVGNNGQDIWEQVFLVERGANYGWSVYEGGHPFQLERKRGPTPISKPAMDHHHAEARSLTGGVVYDGKRLAELTGTYIYGDYSTGKIWGLRHDGTRPTYHRELVDTSLSISGFGLDTAGELLVIDYGGAIYQLDPVPAGEPQPEFPVRLSQTGLFTSTADRRPDPGLIPYSVNAPLWSDGAYKERYIALPGEEKIGFGSNRGWNFPDGTVLVKSFALETETGNPASRTWIETRLMVKQQGEWAGYSYEWNQEQTDAVLVPSAGRDREFVIHDAQTPGGTRTQAWHIPSRAECMVCHSRAAKFVLGLTELQMNKIHDYGGIRDNQLRTLAHLGLFDFTWQQHEQEWIKRLPAWRSQVRRGVKNTVEVRLGSGRPPSEGDPSMSFRGGALLAALDLAVEPYLTLSNGLPNVTWRKLRPKLLAGKRPTSLFPKFPSEHVRLVDPYDEQADLNLRARSYLHANCAQCHVEAGGGNSLMVLEQTADMERMRVLDVVPQHDKFGLPEARIIAAGNPTRSVLLHRVGLRGRGQMPPLASSVVDEQAARMLREWIESLPQPEEK